MQEEHVHLTGCGHKQSKLMRPQNSHVTQASPQLWLWQVEPAVFRWPSRCSTRCGWLFAAGACAHQTVPCKRPASSLMPI